MAQRDYDSTVARIAGNIIGGTSAHIQKGAEAAAVKWAVKLARAIVAETKRTEPKAEGSPVNGAT